MPEKESPSLVIAISLSLGAAIALGFARFNYALLLPAMRTDLAWSYAQAGSMNTANALGYMVGALLTAPLGRRFGLVRTFWVSMGIIGLSLLATGGATNFSLLLLFRLAAGFAGATCFISGATLASHYARLGRSGLVLGIYLGGIGLGIFVGGLGLPQLLENDLTFWRPAWLVMGGLTLLATFVARWSALKVPLPPASQSGRADAIFSLKLLPSLIAYFMFGIGYITYMTFVIAFLRTSGVSGIALSGFWLILGVSTFASGFVWSGLLDRARGGSAMATVMGILAVGAGLPILSTTLFVIAISAILFGGTFATVVSSVTDIVRKSLPLAAWAGAIALYTVLFSIGQTLGPLISGLLADRSDSLTGGFMLSVTQILIGALFAYFQREVDLAS